MAATFYGLLGDYISEDGSIQTDIAVDIVVVPNGKVLSDVVSTTVAALCRISASTGNHDLGRHWTGTEWEDRTPTTPPGDPDPGDQVTALSTSVSPTGAFFRGLVVFLADQLSMSEADVKTAIINGAT